MMPHLTSPAPSNTLSLDQVVARLSQRDVVAGVLTIGTTSGDHLTPASDYDLVLVLSEVPDNLEPYGVTHIDGRLTDLLFVTTEQLDEILALEVPIAGHDWLGRIVRWFQEGDIVFDRCGQLQAVRRRVRTADLLQPLTGDGRAGWWRANYNLAQTRRMRTSSDPVYRIAADLRIALYGPADLLFGYFDIRNLTWSGDKEAVRYLLSNDPDYLARFRAFIAESDADRKFARYEDLTRLTVAPVGELWNTGATALAVSGTNAPPSATDPTLAFWDDLMTPPRTPSG
jgi:hypothetical protein